MYNIFMLFLKKYKSIKVFIYNIIYLEIYILSIYKFIFLSKKLINIFKIDF